VTVYITEYGGFASGRQASPGVPVGNALQTQTLSTGTVYTLGPATRLIMVSADAGSWLFLGSSLSTGAASTSQTSTNPLGACIRVPASVAPFPIIVSPYMRAITNST
jgi:hypothetical protein